MLEISNLHATVADKPILNGISLSVPAGEVHAIMGPNGSGKSTLGYVLAGRPGYEVTEGGVTFAGQDLLALEPHERAAAGLFLGFQYPVEIPGVSSLQFLRESLNSQRRARGEPELTGGEFIKLAREQAALLGMDVEMLKRPVNVGFSGGEKKRAEMVQMGIMNPKFAVLDETDSGLDIDALRAVGAGINRIMRAPDKGVLLITHYQRLLDYVTPDKVHVLYAGPHRPHRADPSLRTSSSAKAMRRRPRDARSPSSSAASPSCSSSASVRGNPGRAIADTALLVILVGIITLARHRLQPVHGHGRRGEVGGDRLRSGLRARRALRTAGAGTAEAPRQEACAA